MKSRTGLQTIRGVVRHVPHVILSERDAQDILHCLPDDDQIAQMLQATLADARDKAKALNDAMDAEEAKWQVTKGKWLEDLGQ